MISISRFPYLSYESNNIEMAYISDSQSLECSAYRISLADVDTLSTVAAKVPFPDRKRPSL
jgi:hypothetical protein